MQGRVRFVWLWCWLGALVVGCNSNASAEATPRMATFALWGWTLTPPTPTPRLRMLRTPTMRATLARLTLMPAPAALILTPPTCHETPSGSLWCVGLIKNPLFVPVDHIAIDVSLLDAAGHVVVNAAATGSRSLLMPNEEAPYDALFVPVPESVVGGVATLIGATEATNSAIVALEVRDVQHERIDVRTPFRPVTVSGTVVNAAREATFDILVVVTLLDVQGEVSGFRQFRLATAQPLPSGESLPFSVRVIPSSRIPSTVNVSAEGRRR